MMPLTGVGMNRAAGPPHPRFAIVHPSGSPRPHAFRYPVLARTALLLGVTGKRQAQDGVVHLVAERLWQPVLRGTPALLKSLGFHEPPHATPGRAAGRTRAASSRIPRRKGFGRDLASVEDRKYSLVSKHYAT